MYVQTMAPSKDKWMRRFIIPETTRHKKGFTIYKVTSVVFLKSSHEEISKVSVWKRYNDFKKLHSELNALYSQSKSKECFPKFPKPKFFGRFEAEVIEERRECALQLLEFIGRHSYLYSSDIFIKFFETSHGDYLTDCSQSLSSDTSAEEDRHTYINSLPNTDVASQNILQPRSIQSSLTNVSVSKNEINQWQETSKAKEQNLQQIGLRYKNENQEISMTKSTYNNLLIKNNDSSKITSKLEDNELICNKNNNCYKNENYNAANEKDPTIVQTLNADSIIGNGNCSMSTHDGSDLPQSCPESSQYILIAAAHMSAAFKHEDQTEYEEAFTQYKMGISSLRSGVESDSNKLRAEIIKEKISKYLDRAEKLYNRYLNCNVSLLSKPISELQYYKVLKIINSVMLVKDVRKNCLNIVKVKEKLSSHKESISNYILRGEIPYMVHLHACIETETSVFLILEHLSRGRLWDFIASRYNPANNKNCGKIITKSVIERSTNDSDILLNECDIKNDILATKLQENVSTNIKVQMEIDPIMGEEKYTDVSTTQLLEKAQILLQSVNATLRESNSVTNRLREADHLINQDTSLLNFKNSVHQPKTCNNVSVDINDISLEIDNVSKPVKNEISAYLSPDNMAITRSQYSSRNSSLNSSYKNLNSQGKESTSSSTDSIKPANTHFETEHKTSNKEDLFSNGYEVNRMDNCRISNDLLTESTKNSNIDDEQELWIIPEDVIRLWAAEILLALEALHQQEVIVFDLKPDNLLLDDNGHVYLTYVIPGHDIDLLKYKHPYSAPELCTFSPMISLSPAADIWSFGVILYELIVGNKFEAKHSGTFQSHSIINIPSKLSDNAKSLLLNVLKYNPNDRMTIPEIKQHPFFIDINWSSLVNTL
ncbi:ribosomal protein S6 kinase delta-1 [Ceratina calcarata]|uniref:Ribosomal protein S6 kinase delta-1 n=1 Tax=Ceratina calcarata TaxID=156304 RepID=A0AAJ7JGX3_9HYME|nr:ribosomal protein S6 kinase delta-1 [Ceratina calcarata]XP_017892930.1 ribosomal protein S6 kinase delta-1 [Ceratina calcarata]